MPAIHLLEGCINPVRQVPARQLREDWVVAQLLGQSKDEARPRAWRGVIVKHWGLNASGQSRGMRLISW